MKFISKENKETVQLAKKLALKVLDSKIIGGAAVIGLVGDLGAGKTTFTQGFAKALGVRRRIISPTFLIFRSYKLKVKGYKFLYHADVYRIKNSKEMDVLGFKEILKNPENIVLIEWADKIKEILPSETIWVKFEHTDNEKHRHIQY